MGLKSDDIHDLLGDNPISWTGEEAEDGDGKSCIREGQGLHSIPDFECNPSQVSTTPQISTADSIGNTKGWLILGDASYSWV